MLLKSSIYQDETVIPRDSGHFDFYADGQDMELLPLRESQIYIEDWIGLRELDETGRLVTLFTEGSHVHMDLDEFAERIVNVYLQ